MTIIEMLKRMADDVSPMVRRRLLDGLRAKQVAMITSTICEAITENGVIVTTEEKKEEIPADSIILAVGYRSDNELYQALEGKIPEVYCIGDAASPQRIREAINDGYRAGLSV